MNWLRENWFKVIVLIVLILVSWYLIKYLDFNSKIKPESFKVENYAK